MSEKVKITPEVTQAASFAKAMSHPVRMYILIKLSEANACCYSGDLAEELQIGASTLSQHFKELKHAGLIQSHSKLPYIKYCINQENWNMAKTLFNNIFK
jgi:predicted transcriptional regulator